jgi:hypothetical protein
MPAPALVTAVASLGRAALAGLGAAARGLGSLAARAASLPVHAQLKAAYLHDKLLRKVGAAMIKHAEKWGVPKRFARDYVRRYMYPNLFGGFRHGGGVVNRPSIEKPQLDASNMLSRQLQSFVGTDNAIYVSAQAQQFAASDVQAPSPQYVSMPQVGVSYSTYVKAEASGLEYDTKQVFAAVQQQDTNVHVVGFRPVEPSGYLQGATQSIESVEAMRDVGSSDIAQQQIQEAVTSESYTLQTMDAFISQSSDNASTQVADAAASQPSSSVSTQVTGVDISQPFDSVNSDSVNNAIEAIESESAQTEQAYESVSGSKGLPDIASVSPNTGAVAGAGNIGAKVLPAAINYESAKPGVSDITVGATHLPSLPFGSFYASATSSGDSSRSMHGEHSLYVAPSHTSNVEVSSFYVSPPMATNTQTTVASGFNMPQHIMFGPSRFEVT